MDYEHLVQQALRSVVFQVLKKTEQFGLTPPHHFYISFQTHYPGVELPDFLQEANPEETTIVLQHQFWDLKVEKSFFTVALSFNNMLYQLRVPFHALLSFIDPAAKFGLQFVPPLTSTNSGNVMYVEIPSLKPAPKEGENNIIAVDFSRKK